VVAVDTAGAARELIEIKDKARAVIAYKTGSGKFTALKSCAKILKTRPTTHALCCTLSTVQDAALQDGPVFTSFIFRVRNVPRRPLQGYGRLCHQWRES
jgi:hypothetical protein